MKTLSVFIVDDEEIDRYLLKRSLKKTSLNIEATEFSNGISVLELLENKAPSTELKPDILPPALIFLDVNMPLLDGFEFLERIKLLKERAPEVDIKVIMITSSDHEEDRERAFSYTFVTGYLLKGDLDTQELTTQIRSALNLL